jgi:general secretion pathway protein K
MIIASTLIAMTRSHGKSMQAERERLAADQAAEAGIALALVALGDPRREWPVDGTKRVVRFNDIDIDVSITAESGKIDLNTGDRTLIRGLLTVEGADPGEADAISDTILDRRGPEGLHHLNSIAEGPGSQSGSGPFEHIGELLRVPGITRALYERIAPNVTLYSGSSSVDVSVAPADVILSIPGNTEADAEAVLRARNEPLHGNDGGDLSRSVGHAFTITSIARMSDGAAAQIREVVRLTGNPKQPVWVLDRE